jgi:hypothetical protein
VQYLVSGDTLTTGLLSGTVPLTLTLQYEW